MKYIYIFDIDQTLLTTNPELLNVMVKKTISKFDPYNRKFNRCHTINKEEMASIFRNILENGDEIGFNTSSGLTKDDMKNFFKSEYNIDLPKDFILLNRFSHPVGKKVYKLKQVEQLRNVTPDHIIVIDDVYDNVTDAKRFGYKGIYADTITCKVIPRGEGYIDKLYHTIENSAQERRELELREAALQARRQQQSIVKAQQISLQAAQSANNAETSARLAENAADRAVIAAQTTRALADTATAVHASAHLMATFFSGSRQDLNIAHTLARLQLGRK